MRSVYIHIPFCSSICSYCDFCKFLYNDAWASAYLDMLSKEIDEYYEGDRVKTIYIGGGTPSSLSLTNLEKLFSIIKKINLVPNGEFTFECNVNDINRDLLHILVDNKVNRISIGIESFDEENLKFLNRKHNKKDIFKKLELVHEYFDNINVDLMYALPTENLRVLKKDLSNMLKLDVSHISTYSLIIEEHTKIYNDKVKPIKEELDYKMYTYICKKLKKKGYTHYEVSNFAKPGKESDHNLTYWHNEEYYGFGLGAHGYVNEVRFENTRNFNKYLKGEYRLNELMVSVQEEMENELILGLRTLKGVNSNKFKDKFEEDIFDTFPNISKALDKKLMTYNKETGDLLINPDKIYIMNEILNMIM